MCQQNCVRVGLVSSLIAIGFCASAHAGNGVSSTRVGSNFRFPVFVTAAPGDPNRLFVLEKRGVIRILRPTSPFPGPTFLNIDSRVGGGTTVNDERGLLGLAFHPDYQNNGFLYVYYTNNFSDSVIARYTVSANPDFVSPTSAVILMTIDQPQTNHNAGWMGFSPIDGYLYIATGDGGNGCDTGAGHTSGTGNAQDITNNLLGKILRIDVDGNNGPGGNYGIPASNPFVGVTGDDEIWSYGLRNPWRCSFDRQTGDLYIGDVGQAAREEIDYQPVSSGGGENYGWRCMEGDVCSSASGCSTTGCTCGSPVLTMPIHAYAHNPPPPPAGFVCAVTGGYAYRGCKMPALAGTFFFADYCGNAIWSFEVVGGVQTNFANRTGELSPSIEGLAVQDIVSFGEDANGEIYIVDQGSGFDGQIFKIIPETPTADCDGNGVFELNNDLPCFVNALLGIDTNPPGGICRADLNGDNATNGEDVSEFVQCAVLGGCP